MSEIFLKQKISKSIDLQGEDPHSPAPEFTPYTLLVCTKLSYMHENHYLTENQVNDLFRAAKVAHETNRELNRFITIHLKDLKNILAQNLVSNIMEKTRKWLQRKGFEHAHIWVLENGDVKGIHAHILLHIPNHYIHQYKRQLKKWLPMEIAESGLDIKKVKYPEWGQLGQRSCVYGALKYMCKGINPKTPTRGIKPIYQGEIMGRRCGYSKL